MARVRLGHLITCALACLAAANATETKISRWMDPAECASFELPREATTQSHYQLLLAARSPDIRHAFQSKLLCCDIARFYAESARYLAAVAPHLNSSILDLVRPRYQNFTGVLASIALFRAGCRLSSHRRASGPRRTAAARWQLMTHQLRAPPPLQVSLLMRLSPANV